MNQFYKKKDNIKLKDIINFLIEKNLLTNVVINKNHYNIDNINNIIDNCDILQNQQFINIKNIDDAGKNDISFISNRKYINKLANTSAGLYIIDNKIYQEYILGENNIVEDNNLKFNNILLVTENAYYSYAFIIDLLYQENNDHLSNQEHKIHPSTLIDKSAKIGENVIIGPNVIIEPNCVIGDNSCIRANSHIGQNVIIGNNANIYEHVIITNSIIGKNSNILTGAKIGQDGFGFATHNGHHKKIFHIGKILIGDNVSIGAGTTIDRGSLNDTILEDNCQIDNLVQIGHNVQIGAGTVIAAQVGISGSTKIGKYCYIGGQVGFNGHINIADYTTIAGKSCVIKSINETGQIVGGIPAMPIKQWHRQNIKIKNL